MLPPLRKVSFAPTKLTFPSRGSTGYYPWLDRLVLPPLRKVSFAPTELTFPSTGNTGCDPDVTPASESEFRADETHFPKHG